MPSQLLLESGFQTGHGQNRSKMLRLLHEIIAYVKTADYFHAVVAGLTILVIEILLLSICIPMILTFVERVRTKRFRVIIDFYLFQTFHWITRMFLDMANMSVQDTFPILDKELQKNPKFKYYSHPVYGNLENILFVLDKVFAKDEEFKTLLERKTPADFKEYETTCDKCVTEIDRLIAMLSNLPTVQQEVFKMRMLVYVLRDGIHDTTDVTKKHRWSDPTYELRRCIQDVTKRIEKIFQKRKRLTDSVLRNQHRLWVARLIIGAPYVVLRRWIAIRWCRIHDRPYKDSHHPSYSAFLLAEWREHHGFTLSQAARILSMTEKHYRDLEYGYCIPTLEEWEPVKKHLRGEVAYPKSD